MDSVVQILQVTVRNTRSGRAVYDVACGDGVTRAVWDAGMANALNALAGQNVPIREKIEQKGQYTNRTIIAFAQPGQQLPPDTNAQLAPVGGIAQPLTGGPVQTIQPSPARSNGGGGNGGSWPEERTVRVTKLAAIEYGATLVGGLLAGAGPEAFEEAVDLTLKASKAFYKAARSHEATTAAVDPVQAQLAAAQAIIDAAKANGALVTPEAVAAVVPGVTVGAPTEQSPEAVAAAQDAAAESADVIEWD